MAIDTWFGWANQMAVLGWLCLLLGLLAEGVGPQGLLASRLARWALFVGGRLLPVLLCAAYALAVLRWFGGAAGGFGSLVAVERLFETRGMVFAGWLHYLAFDLWMGRWQIDQLNKQVALGNGPGSAWVWRLAAVPCLLMTFLFGPVGLLLFLILIGARWLIRRSSAIGIAT